MLQRATPWRKNQHPRDLPRRSMTSLRCDWILAEDGTQLRRWSTEMMTREKRGVSGEYGTMDRTLSKKWADNGLLMGNLFAFVGSWCLLQGKGLCHGPDHPSRLESSSVVVACWGFQILPSQPPFPIAPQIGFSQGAVPNIKRALKLTGS